MKLTAALIVRVVFANGDILPFVRMFRFAIVHAPGRCYNWGLHGHCPRDLPAGDRKNKCKRFGEWGHMESNCDNSPKKLRFVLFDGVESNVM
ncbi:unnamed protein product [Microthlaspi erraticum]|uniref:Uncharacterized protein n=1 Tax=Microthlaspi erraticum TaxID=1685480 RepID=A0A6D2I5D1_9BRAS|nr:unnamed protein product [Microthlaspi erraticum]